MFKRLRNLLLSGMMPLLLVACNTETVHHDYTFAGEGNKWSAEYVQQATEKFSSKKGKTTDYETWKNVTFQLRYKGEQTDLGEIKHFKYSYKGIAEGGGGTMEGAVSAETLKSESSGSGAFEWEDSVIKVEVEWDGLKEQFELKIRK